MDDWDQMLANPFLSLESAVSAPRSGQIGVGELLRKALRGGRGQFPAATASSG